MSKHRGAYVAFLYLLSMAMMAVTGVLLAAHAKTVLAVERVSLPLVASLPSLERRLSILTDQVEVAELQSVLRIGSQEERVRVFVLPTEPDFDRLLAFLDIAGAVLTQRNFIAHLSEITIDDVTTTDHAGVQAYPVSLQFSAHHDGVQMMLALVRLAGYLTVGDALTNEERSFLLERTEEENPAGVVALEQFLSTDLLHYAQEPRSFEEQLLHSFASPTFEEAFQLTLRQSFLRDVTVLLGGAIGQELDARNLWPLPYLTLGDLVLEKGEAAGWYRVSMKMFLYTAADPL